LNFFLGIIFKSCIIKKVIFVDNNLINNNVAIENTINVEDKLRSDMYSFIANLIRTEPNIKLINSIKNLEGDDSPIGKSIKLLTKLSTNLPINEIHDEYVRLFIGVGRGELLPYSSYYLTGFLNDKPLSRLKDDMGLMGIVRKENVKEPEDHISSLFDIMSGMIVGSFDKIFSLKEQSDFFEKHINPWAHLLMLDIETSKSAVFYVPVGTIGKEFIQIERDVFRMGNPG